MLRECVTSLPPSATHCVSCLFSFDQVHEWLLRMRTAGLPHPSALVCVADMGDDAEDMAYGVFWAASKTDDKTTLGFSVCISSQVLGSTAAETFNEPIGVGLAFCHVSAVSLTPVFILVCHSSP